MHVCLLSHCVVGTRVYARLLSQWVIGCVSACCYSVVDTACPAIVIVCDSPRSGALSPMGKSPVCTVSQDPQARPLVPASVPWPQSLLKVWAAHTPQGSCRGPGSPLGREGLSGPCAGQHVSLSPWSIWGTPCSHREVGSSLALAQALAGLVSMSRRPPPSFTGTPGHLCHTSLRVCAPVSGRLEAMEMRVHAELQRGLSSRDRPSRSRPKGWQTCSSLARAPFRVRPA